MKSMGKGRGLRHNNALQRTRSAPLRSPLNFKPFGAAVKIRAGRLACRRAAPRSTGHSFICPSALQRPAPWAQRTPWHLEGLTAKGYRATRGIQLI
jgi:hypothetical protein